MKDRFFRSPGTQAALVLVLSVLLGIGTYLYLMAYQTRVASENELTPILVAKSEIPLGTSLGEIFDSNLFEVRNVPRSSVPATALAPGSTPDEALKTRGPLAPGQILVTSFFSAEVRQDVGLSIPRGMLAVTIAVDDVSRVGNFVLPGSRVVVFTTASSNSGNPVTSVLLPEALVIGIGNETDINGNATTPTASPLVTVALQPDDAKRLILASKSAQITLALAHGNDPLAVISGDGVANGTTTSGN